MAVVCNLLRGMMPRGKGNLFDHVFGMLEDYTTTLEQEVRRFMAIQWFSLDYKLFNHESRVCVNYSVLFFFNIKIETYSDTLQTESKISGR